MNGGKPESYRSKKMSYTYPALAIKFALSTAMVSALYLPSTSLWAASEVQSGFSVPAGSLENALLSVARQGNQTISFSPALVKNYQVPAIKGNFTTRQLVLKLLQHTPLILNETQNGTLTVEAAKATPTSSLSSTEQTAVNSGQSLPTITVNNTADDDNYVNVTNSSTATRSDTPLQQVPQSVSTVSNNVLRAQQAQTLDDALRNISGVVSAASTAQGGPTYYIRGYEAQNVLNDGLATPTGSYQDIDGIQTVEVVKGPSALLSGQASPGGSINIVKKKPTDQTIHDLKQEYGSYGHVKTALDLGGKVDNSNNLSYRLNMSWTDGSKGNGSYFPERGKYIAPALKWSDNSTRLTVGGEYYQHRNPLPAYTYARWTGYDDMTGTGAATDGKPVKRGRSAIGPTDSRLIGEGGNVYYDLEQDLNDHLTLFSKAQFQKERDDLSFWALQAAPGEYSSNSDEAFLSPYASHDKNHSLSFDNYLRSKFTTGSAEHTLIAGWNLSEMKYRSYEPNNMSYLDGFYDVVANDRSLVPSINATGPYNSTTQKVRQSGLYLQEQMTLAEKWHFLASIRNTQYWARSNTLSYQGEDNPWLETSSDAHASAWTPAFGIARDITPWMTAYVNYLKGFNTATLGLVDKNGNMLSPSSDKQLEVGTKFNFLDDNLSLTTAIFHIRRSNTAVAAGFNSSGNTYYEQTSGQESKGVEIELSGTPLPGWDITGSYTWQETWQPDDKSYIIAGQPKHAASLWTAYEFQSGMLRGINGSIGLTARSKTYAGTNTDNDDVFLPGQLRTDLSVGYRSPWNWSATLGVKNVFNKELYLPSSSGSSYIPLDVERTYMLTLDYSF